MTQHTPKGRIDVASDARTARALERFRPLFELFEARDHELYLVGGCVRDLLMDVDPKDYDFATDAPPAETSRVLKAGGLRVIPIGEAFGTIATVIDGGQYEITTYRVKESYKKGSRHPDVVFGHDLHEDLGRRDLTINAMAMDRRGSVVDPYGGQEDLARGVLRVPGGGHEKTREIFADDPLRLLRVGRFAARLGFEPDTITTDEAREVAATVLEVSRERWTSELDKLLAAESPLHGLSWLRLTGVLQMCLPELAALSRLDSGLGFSFFDIERERYESPVRTAFDSDETSVDALTQSFETVEAVERGHVVLAWAALLHAVGLPAALSTGRGLGAASISGMLVDGISRRLRFSNARRERVRRLIEEQSFWSRPTILVAEHEVSRPGVRRMLLKMEDDWEALLALVRARARVVRRSPGHSAADAPPLERHLAAIESRMDELDLAHLAPELPTGLGTQILSETSVERGPRLGRIIDWLRDEIIDERLPNNASTEVYVAAVREALAAESASID